MNEFDGIRVPLGKRMRSPVAREATDVYLEGHDLEFTANWSLVDGATGYILDVSKDQSFTPEQMVEGYEEMIIDPDKDYVVVEVTDNSISYYYRVRATDGRATSGITRIITVPAKIIPEA